jgi:NAD(P)-dependent dehydrogenase (short-subunit alcohol dehydrogenase family)
MTITSRFGYHSTALEVIDGHDLHGTYALVTGGASGIGVETVRALAVAGADITIVARNGSAASKVAAELGDHHPSASLHVIEVDLANLASVRAGAATFLKRGVPLSILINNAGVMATPFARTNDGFEMQFGTNHLGHFVLTSALVPALRLAAGARVVSLSSSGHRRSDVHFEDPNYEHRPYDRWGAYGQSKTANALFAVELTRRFGAEGIFANAVMPGGIMTGLQKHMSHDERVAAGFVDAEGKPNVAFKTPAAGASTSIWAAVGDELAGVGGRYLENCAEAGLMDPATPYVGYMPYALDPEHARRLWDLSERLVGE